MSPTLYSPGDVLGEVALFPLPQVVLFPGAEMPLHVFEPRYRTMTRDVMASTRQLCVVQIPEDHDVGEHGQPQIARVAGLGEIARCDALPDGRFNILVEGKARVRLEELPFRRPYRRARVTVLGSNGRAADSALVRALSTVAGRVAQHVRECHPAFRFSLPCTDDAGVLCDVCAHYLVLDGTERQELLETLDVGERISRCLSALCAQESLFGPGDAVH